MILAQSMCGPQDTNRKSQFIEKENLVPYNISDVYCSRGIAVTKNFVKTIQMEEVFLWEYQTLKDVKKRLRVIDPLLNLGRSA